MSENRWRVWRYEETPDKGEVFEVYTASQAVSAWGTDYDVTRDDVFVWCQAENPRSGQRKEPILFRVYAEVHYRADVAHEVTCPSCGAKEPAEAKPTDRANELCWKCYQEEKK